MQDVNDLLLLNSVTSHMRNDRWDHERLDWDSHVAKLKHEDKFANEYTMSWEAHQKLVSLLQPTLQRAEYNSRCSEPIRVEHIVAAGLRVLSGGRVKDQRHIVGTSRTAAYDAVDDFIDAVNGCDSLAINFPSSAAGWQRVREGFSRKSSNRIIDGAVMCIDGFFQRTNKPASTQVANVLAYYSGHYESYGVNCQAAVQSDLQFLYFGVQSPGSTNDNISYALAEGLNKVVDSLPLGLYALGDAAYTLSEHLLIPFTGADRFNPAHDSFNYYLSQLRIRVEMAFGRLVNKFRILNGKIEGSLDRVTAILTACARLHNFIIQEDGPFETEHNYKSVQEEMDQLEIRAHPSAPLGMSYLPVVPDENFQVYHGISHTRQAIVEYLQENEIGRPLHNIEQKKREMAEMAYIVSPGGVCCERGYVSPI